MMKVGERIAINGNREFELVSATTTFEPNYVVSARLAESHADVGDSVNIPMISPSHARFDNICFKRIK